MPYGSAEISLDAGNYVLKPTGVELVII